MSAVQLPIGRSLARLLQGIELAFDLREINATLPKTTAPETVTLEEAVALIDAKAKNGKGRAARKPAGKAKATTGEAKKPASKAAGKKPAKKAPAKAPAKRSRAASKPA